MEDDFDISQLLDDSDQLDEKITVSTPSGGTIVVMNQEEADYYDQIASRYQSDNKFKNISDILELDRILTMELMCYRWSLWILAEEDYDGKRINVGEIQKSIENYSKEIRGIKKDLGIDKSTRDKDKGESTAEYIHMLGIRAKEFGITRNKQAYRAITILNELVGLINLYENSSESERREFGVKFEDIIEWIKKQFDEFSVIDEELRKNQSIWIRDL
jgi:hypothetical protein